ncbi:iron ABC transporter permease [Devosia epidermidihirudinis]|uniref:Iron ABC transporter permease n=1 Tax=Devosia epidermidihirudinis TaxID=1293439 RepID=A0A0F5QE64_9HYPH|nr:iron ABC transporter permease [Devosia epidermidihirudinis]KKC39277.1 iron ABC transporter permease [Devosia epidermidihirudinis]
MHLRPTWLFALILALLFAAAVGNLMVGAAGFSVEQSLRALFLPDTSVETALIWEVRLPRVLLAVLVGANLAVAGVLIQTLTRNPLASPQTFGINGGAALAIVVAVIAVPGLSGGSTVVPAFVGAAVIGMIMWILSLSNAITPLKLALAGIALQLVLAAMVQAVLIANNASADIVYWLAGSVTTAQWSKVWTILPFSLVGIVVAIAGGHHFGLLALDTSTGMSLGQNARRTGGLASALIVILAGSSVAVAGPIGFVGLMVPHIVRTLVGEEQRTVLILSVAAGPLLLVAADLGGKLVAYPAELPVGIITAILGAPAFLPITWRNRNQ